MSMDKEGFEPAPPSAAEKIAEGPSGLPGPKMIGMTLQQIFDPAPPTEETEYHVYEPEFMMGPRPRRTADPSGVPIQMETAIIGDRVYTRPATSE